MIDPKLLTKEFGFEDGVVVEINGKTLVYEGVYSYSGGFHPVVWTHTCAFMPTEITSIRPLTGSMAIWNFAPEWANYLGVDGGTFFFTRKRPQYNPDVTERPWWAK